SADLAKNLHIQINDKATLIGSTANGGMAIYNFNVAGITRHGIAALDRNMIYADIKDVQYALNMEGASGEILGFFENGRYSDKQVLKVKADFKALLEQKDMDQDLVLLSLMEQDGLDEFVAFENMGLFLIVGAMIIAMMVVLWNSGL